MNHGGKREGAGRPKKRNSKVPISATVKRMLKRRLLSAAREHGHSVSLEIEQRLAKSFLEVPK